MSFWSKYQWTVVGVAGTLVIHLIVMLFLSFKSMPKVVVVNEVMIDFSQETATEIERPEKELVGKTQPSKPLTNVAADVNSDTKYSKRINKSELSEEVDKMVSDLESQYELEANKTETALDELEKKRQERQAKRILHDRESPDEEAEQGAAELNATAEWFLEERKNYRLPLPSYVCKGEGLVRINVKVNRQGEVISAIIDENRTNTKNECLRKNAIEYTLRAQFNDDFSAVLIQKGWIQFLYARQ